MLIESQLKRLGFGTAAIFLLIVAMLISVPQMYLMTLIIGLVPVVGWFANKFLTRGIQIERAAPHTANQRSRHPVDLVIQNKSWMPKFYIRLNDSLPRQVRYGGTSPNTPSFIPMLWPGEKTSVRYYIEPVTRGIHKVGPLNMMSTDILGFTTAKVVIPGTAEVLVYPEVLPVAPVVMSTGTAIGLRDDQDARSKGSGTDFSGVREYQMGDELRRINWKSTARTGSLVVTEYSQGFASDISIVLDCNADAYKSSGHGEVSAFEYAVKIAVAFGVTALGRGSLVTLIGCADDEHGLLPTQVLSGATGTSKLLEIMARVSPSSSIALEQILDSRPENSVESASAIVITPRQSSDSNLRMSLLNRFSHIGSNGLQMFWLDTPAFVKMEGFMASGEVTRSAFTATSSGIFEMTTLAREYNIEPETNLVAVLGGLSYGG